MAPKLGRRHQALEYGDPKQLQGRGVVDEPCDIECEFHGRLIRT